MRRNSSPTALGDRSRESWTEAVAPKTLAFHDANSDGGVRSPWTCMARSAKGGEHGPTAAHSPLDFVVQSVHFSWRSILACHTRSFNTKRILSKMSNRTSMEVSPAERDALVLLLEKEQKSAADAAEERLMRMRASVCKRLQALTFEGMIYDWERSSIDLSNDEADLLLDTLGTSAPVPLAGLHRRIADRR